VHFLCQRDGYLSTTNRLHCVREDEDEDEGENEDKDKEQEVPGKYIQNHTHAS
jgi:hypothetical protein